MNRRPKPLTPGEHVEVGRLLKEARNDLLIAANMCRGYGKLSVQLVGIADSFMGQRAWLERKLIEAVGEDAMVESTHVRDVYFGEIGAMEEVE
jgi:hypothetical protein